MSETLELFSWLAQRCQKNIGTNEQAKTLLRGSGITDEKTWASYGAGVGDVNLRSALDAVDWAKLITSGVVPRQNPDMLRDGVLFPTYHPENVKQPIGFIKCGSQGKHRYLAEPAGLMVPANINDFQRVVLTNVPMQALRLAQAGAQAVACAVSEKVLPPMKEWLSCREVLLCRQKESEPLANTLKTMAIVVQSLPVHVQLRLTNAATLRVLGIEGIRQGDSNKSVAKVEFVLRDLIEFAKARLADGHGVEALRALNADNPVLLQAFSLGFLPAGFQSSVSESAGALLSDRNLENAVIVPALDTGGVVVDFLALRPGAIESYCGEAAGLLAPSIASAYDEIIACDSLTKVAASFKAGKKNAMLFRGLGDLKNNAERLFACGVRSAEVDFEQDISEALAVLESAGIAAHARSAVPVVVAGHVSVEAGETITAKHEPVADAPLVSLPEFSAKPEFVSRDERLHQATFKAADAVYAIETSLDATSRLEVKLERNGQVHLDRFDLSSEAQRRRFAVSAAVKTKVPFEVIGGHLIHLLDSVRQIQSEIASPTKRKVCALMPEAERNEALEALKSPDLLEKLAADLDALGWVGEEKTKRLLYLASISRKLPSPLSAALLSSSGAGKSKAIETIALLTPAEDLVHVSRLSDTSLFYFDKDALRHKLLVVDESDALSRDVLVALRVLQSRGSLTHSHVMRDPSTGQVTTHCGEAKGPVAILTSTAGELEEQMLSRCFHVAVDESPEQTRRIAEAALKLRADPSFAGSNGRQAAIIKRHHAMQRMLEERIVVIPFAARIEFPASSVKHRRMLEKMLNLIEASALLHQHQRLKQKNAGGEEYVIADMRDYEIATDLVGELIGRASDELSVNAREVLALIQTASLTMFTMEDLKGIKPEWTRYRFRAGLDELLKLEVLTSPKGGRGAVRQYRLQASTTEAQTPQTVRLLSGAEVGELAKVGEVGFANFIPEAATG